MTSSTNTLNPWKEVWTKPTKTILFLLTQKKTLGLWALCFLAGLQCIPAFKLFDWYFFLLAPFIGLFNVYIASTCLYLVGKIFKGQAQFWHVRTAILWSCLPISLTWILSILTFKSLHFNCPRLITFLLSLVTMLSTLIGTVWSICMKLIFVKTVQKFNSYWIAFVNSLLALILNLAICFGPIIAINLISPDIIYNFISKIHY